MPSESQETQGWDDAGENDRLIAVIACGWITGKNKVSQTGLKIMRTRWADLSPAARRILGKKGFPPT